MTPPGFFRADDVFAVIISTDNGLTWSKNNSLAVWDNVNSQRRLFDPVSKAENITLSLYGYSGQTRIAFYGGAEVARQIPTTVYIDNVVIGYNEVPVIFNPPRNLRASIGNNVINLVWTEPLPGGTGVFTGYKVYRNGISITDFVYGLNFTDIDIVNETQYTYTIKAIYTNPDRESVPSNSVQITSYAQTTAEQPIGTGTESDPFLISSFANLKWLSETPSVWGGYSVEDCGICYTCENDWGWCSDPIHTLLDQHYFLQTADIDAIETMAWGFAPIGGLIEWVGKPFMGNYNGGNKSIMNLHIKTVAPYLSISFRPSYLF